MGRQRAEIYMTNLQTGIDAVIQDSHGLVIASMPQQIPQLLTAVEIEAAVAAARALEFALEVGINQVVLKGNSMLVIQALDDETLCLAGVRNYIRDAISFSNSFR